LTDKIDPEPIQGDKADDKPCKEDDEERTMQEVMHET
jgi:hypothetical protein